MGDWSKEERELHRALCNFCNQAGDPFEPVATWDDFVWKSIRRLSKAYNEWYKFKGDDNG